MVHYVISYYTLHRFTHNISKTDWSIVNLPTSVRGPFLCKGMIFAYFHSEGNSLALKEFSNINFNGYAILFAVSISILE